MPINFTSYNISALSTEDTTLRDNHIDRLNAVITEGERIMKAHDDDVELSDQMKENLAEVRTALKRLDELDVTVTVDPMTDPQIKAWADKADDALDDITAFLTRMDGSFRPERA